MPIPKPKAGENEQEFVSRCISEIYDEYGQEQSSAICYSTYREEKMKKTTTDRVAAKISKLSKDYEGIKLLPNGEVNMIEPNPCWSGYEAIGTKMVNGKEVPNCVPVE